MSLTLIGLVSMEKVVCVCVFCCQFATVVCVHSWLRGEAEKLFARRAYLRNLHALMVVHLKFNQVATNREGEAALLT